MDTELARTFLAILEAGSFVGAAERLHVSQSTVSARVVTLERALGATVFVRHRGGAALTDAGRRFRRHASTLVRTVAQARDDVGIDERFRASVTLGARIALWQGLLAGWLPALRVRAPDVALRAEIGFEPDLMQGLVDGRLDVGVMYTPQSRPGLVVERLFDDTLVLVSTRADQHDEPDPGYVHVDWGPEFHAQHRASFPDWPGPAVVVNIGLLGLQQLALAGGSGYFPQRLVADDLADGRLHRVPGTPTFVLPAYAVYPSEPDSEDVMTAVEVLRGLSGAE